MVLPQFLLPIPAVRVGARSVSARKENQMMWKKKMFGNCGNAIVEKWEEKKIVVAEIWGGIKKISVTSTIFLQHFHNKSHMISYY